MPIDVTVQKPANLDRLGELLLAGRDLTAYLYQVPDDVSEGAKLRSILAEAVQLPDVAKRREMPELVDEMIGLVDQLPSMAAVDQLHAGFDRLIRLWDSARSGMFKI